MTGGELLDDSEKGMVRMRGTQEEMERYRYGDTSLWTVEKHLGGSRAKRLLEHLELYFGEGGSGLLLDLRGAVLIDSDGAEALERAARRHPGLAVVGLPRDYESLPRRIRASLRTLRPVESIEKGFTSLNGKAQDTARWREQRRHCRIPVHMHVEAILGNMSTAVLLHDVSLGGGRIGRLPRSWIKKIEDLDHAPTITLTGMDYDPLGREITGCYDTDTLVSQPVHLLPGSTGIGVRFAGAVLQATG